MSLPLTIESPNEVPSPASASAVAESVAFSLTGSTCSAIDVTVSNGVLNSVVTDETSMTSVLEMGRVAGFSGDVNATYLLPNTVLAWMSATTFAGITWTYFGSTSRTSLAFGVPPTLAAVILATRPISTPL
jgi:hypothetical protein